MKIVLKDKDNQVVFANTDATCLFCLLSHASEGESKVIKCAVLCRKTRCICCINGDYTALLCSGKSEDVNSSKAIKHKVAACFDIWDAMVHFAETTEAQTISYINKLTHNLVSIQARNTQEMFALIPQEKLTGDIHGQISAISSIITSNSVKASQTLLQLIKNNLAMKSEFTSSIFLFPNRKLIEKKIRLTFKNHPIRNVLLNVAHAFFSDFTDHGVTINVGECQATVKLDYDTFRVALFHVIDNATKYIQPHSNFDIEFITKAKTLSIRFCMKSCPILPHEVGKLGTEGFSGEIPTKLSLNGSGQGLWRTKMLLEVNNSTLNIYPNYTNEGRMTYNGFEYESNCFEVVVPNEQIDFKR